MPNKRQEKMHNRLRNKTLSVVGFSIIGSCIFCGIFGMITKEYQIGILFIMIV